MSHMSFWVTSLMFAVLVATVPLTWVLRLLLNLPAPLALSHDGWPLQVNFAIIGVITADVTIFIRSVYYGGPSDPITVGMEFLITGVIYVFGFVLLLRQFAGLYPEYFVTTGKAGLVLRKARYTNVADIEVVSEARGETHLRIHMRNGENHPLNLPTRHVVELHKAIESAQPQD